MTTVVELALAADPSAWAAAGFTVDGEGVVRLGGIGVRLVGGSGGFASWTLADAVDSADDIDGLRTLHASADSRSIDPVVHPNGVSSIDHVVVYTPDLERTCAAIEAATAAPLKRIREVGQLRQGFHRLGELIVEVVTFPGVTGDHAQLWGLALNVVDIDAIFERRPSLQVSRFDEK